MELASRIELIRQQITLHAVRAGRSPDEVTLVAVSKTVPAEVVRQAAIAGIGHVGENRAQELRDKFPLLADQSLTWHFVGHLQTNKIKYVVKVCRWVHSLDRLALAHELSRWAVREDRLCHCLVQVNIAAEDSKFGLPPDKVAGFLAETATFPGIRVEGLMTVAPWTEDPEQVRPVFRALRELRDRLQERAPAGVWLRHLSMGMSDDFPVAVEEGATIIRVGRALFGPRTS